MRTYTWTRLYFGKLLHDETGFINGLINIVSGETAPGLCRVVGQLRINLGTGVGLYPRQEWMKTLSQFLENTLPTARKQELRLSPERAASCLYSGILLLWLFNNSTDPSQEKIRGTLANRIRVEATTMWSQRVNHFVFERTAATAVLSSSLVCVMALPVESFLNRVFITVPCSLTLSHSLTMSPADTKCSTSRSAITCNLHNSNRDKSQKQEISAQ